MVEANHATVFVFEALLPTIQLLIAQTMSVEVLFILTLDEDNVSLVPVALLKKILVDDSVPKLILPVPVALVKVIPVEETTGSISAPLDATLKTDVVPVAEALYVVKFKRSALEDETTLIPNQVPETLVKFSVALPSSNNADEVDWVGPVELARIDCKNVEVAVTVRVFTWKLFDPVALVNVMPVLLASVVKMPVPTRKLPVLVPFVKTKFVIVELAIYAWLSEATPLTVRFPARRSVPVADRSNSVELFT